MTTNLDLSKIKNLKWYQLCALLLSLSAVIAASSYAVQTGTLTPDQASSIITGANDRIDNLTKMLNDLNQSTLDALVTSWNPTVPNTNSTYSYMIRSIQGTTNTWYYAQNGTDDGRICWTSTNATYLIQQPIDTLAATGKGGSVMLMGIFFLNGTIYLYQEITLKGQGIIERDPINTTNSQLVLPNGATYPAITIKYDPVSPVWASSPDYSFACVSDLVIIGSGTGVNYAGQDGIYITDVAGAVYDVIIKNVGIFYVADNAINTASVAKLWVTNCYIEHQVSGAGIKQTAGTVHAQGNYIYDNTYGIYSNQGATLDVCVNTISANRAQAIYLKLNTAACQIQGNYMANNGNSTYAAVHFAGSSGTTMFVTITFSGNQLMETRAITSSAKYGLFIDGGSGNVTGLNSGNTYHANYGWNATSAVKYNTYSTTILQPIVMVSQGNRGSGLNGILATPISGSTYYIVASGGTNATWINGATYRNIETAKDFYITGGTVSALSINGKAISNTTTTFYLNAGDTFTPAFTGTLTMVVNSKDNN